MGPEGDSHNTPTEKVNSGQLEQIFARSDSIVREIVSEGSGKSHRKIPSIPTIHVFTFLIPLTTAEREEVDCERDKLRKAIVSTPESVRIEQIARIGAFLSLIGIQSARKLLVLGLGVNDEELRKSGWRFRQLYGSLLQQYENQEQ